MDDHSGLPTVEQLANADPATVRCSGVTQRRADGIVAIAQIAHKGGLISEREALADESAAHAALILCLRWGGGRRSRSFWGSGSTMPTRSAMSRCCERHGWLVQTGAHTCGNERAC